jgi:aspartyl-tRNA(Asn)/glutamyl-tRNA(Gln) amidotransferase subunit C
VADRITRAEVEHVAKLARLALSDDEVAALTGELGAILDYAAEVSALDTHDVAPTAHPLPLVNVFRPDVARAGVPRAEVLAAAPAAEADKFRVPRILGEAP